MHFCDCYYIDYYVVCFSVSKADAVGLFRTFIKQLYDLRMSSSESTSQLLPKLYIDNFDNEQIFQQLEMFNNHAVEGHRRAIKSVCARNHGTAAKAKKNSLSSHTTKDSVDDSRSVKKQVTFKPDDMSELAADADDSSEEDAVVDGDVDSEEESVLQKLLDSMSDKRTPVKNDDVDSDVDNDDDEDSEATRNSDSDDNSDTANDRTASASQHRNVPKQKVRQISAVDDRFFKLDEMEAFLDEQDLKEQQQHSANADDTEDDDDYDLSADDKVALLL